MKTISASGRYNIVGYSFGATVAFEMSLQLQEAGEECSLILLDGSHSYVKMFTSTYSEDMQEEQKELAALASFLEQNFNFTDFQQVRSSNPPVWHVHVLG